MIASRTKQISWVVFLFYQGVIFYLIFYGLKSISFQHRYPAGDGPHILGVASRLSQLLVDGELTSFVYCFSSLLGPHPPFAYLPFIIAEFIFPNQEWTHLVGSGIILWLC